MYDVPKRASDSQHSLTIAQVAERLQCSPDTVRREIARGNLKAVRFGRLIRIRESDLDRAQRAVTPAQMAYSGADR
ncbi:helix-turn-helix domain-containing protein [Myceligenerans crystallogenes]|uniref:Helix-turn-helix domain-containing protein n=1 Tax=Myceligenerans crystallogenes TaxID=316335 RepID=A0ABN2NAW1_9MICO